MDSSSLGVSCGSNDSLHGLKFGKKIYFEDGASAAGSGSSSGPSSKEAPPPPPAVKKGKGAAQGGARHPPQPPRCQVEGCNADLSGTKAYYCRHKVCKMHSKEPKVIVGGLEQRFCQQCSRFHQLPEFDQGKRSCRRRLAGHNERRRKPPPAPFASRYGRLVSPFHEPYRFRSFLMDFNCPRVSSIAPDIWPTMRTGDRVPNSQWQGVLGPPNAAAGAHPYLPGPSGMTLYSAPEAPPGDSLAGVTDSSCALSLLSTQPWGNNATTNRTPPISVSSSFQGTPMAQQVVSDDYMAGSWGFRAHGGRANSLEIQHDAGLVGMLEAGNAHFSGELELALQGNMQHLNHGSDRAYGHSGPGTHWSL